MKVKVIREITKTYVYEEVIDFNMDKDDPYYLDEDLPLKHEQFKEDQTWFEDPETGNVIDLCTDWEEQRGEYL